MAGVVPPPIAKDTLPQHPCDLFFDLLILKTTQKVK
jgi:hypothetical protein